MKVLVGTKNPGKLEGAKRAFENYFKNVEIIGVKVSSNVADQPVNLDTYKGAKNRVINLIKYAKENNIEADYYCAIESGISNGLGKWAIINVSVVVDKNGYESFGTSSGFPVPESLVQKIIDTDLGSVMDDMFKQSELHNSVGGISFLTHDKITRIDITEQAFVMALTHFVNDVWKSDTIINVE